MCFDGADGECLFIACGTEVYVRKINAPSTLDRYLEKK